MNYQVLTHTAPTLEPAISSARSFLGKKVLKSQGLSEGGQRAQTSSYKISQLWGCNVHSGDYS